MSYIEVTGKSEDEAIANALRQLGLERDDVSVQVLERAKSGFLGLGSQPAKIRVTYGLPDEEPEEEEAPPAPAPQPERSKEPEPAPQPVRTREPREPKEPREPRLPREPREPKAARPAPAPAERAAQELGEEVDDEKAQAIKKFLTGLLEQLETPAEVHVYLPEKGRYKVLLTGKDLGALIGRRGETLDAIQQLTGYSVNRTGGRVRVQLDAENYRERREESLQRLARKVAGKVVRFRRSVTLEPMNAYERHVIHTALQDTPYVTTHSTGVDPNRRVVVTYDRDKR